MSDEEHLDTQEAIQAMQDEMEMDDPTEDEEEDEEDAEFSISERKLLWGVIIVLGIFALLEGAVIVNWGARIRSMEKQGPGMVGGGALFTGGEAPPAVGGVGGGGGPGNIVSGQAAVQQVVEAFVADKELDAETGKALVAMMVESERALESIPQRQRSGELEASDVADVMKKEMEGRQTQLEEILGEALAAELNTAMGGGPAAAMAPPGAGKPPVDPDGKPPELVDPGSQPPPVLEPGDEAPAPVEPGTAPPVQIEPGEAPPR